MTAEAVAVELDGALGDTRALWQAWLEDASRRLRVELAVPEDRGQAVDVLDRALGSWQPLLERFAEEHVPVYLRPRAEASAALRRLQAAGVRIGVFTDAPAVLADVALSHLGAARRVDAVEVGQGALERLLKRLGPGTVVVHSADELTRLAP